MQQDCPSRVDSAAIPSASGFIACLGKSCRQGEMDLFATCSVAYRPCRLWAQVVMSNGRRAEPPRKPRALCSSALGGGVSRRSGVPFWCLARCAQMALGLVVYCRPSPRLCMHVMHCLVFVVFWACSPAPSSPHSRGRSRAMCFGGEKMYPPEQMSR